MKNNNNRKKKKNNNSSRKKKIEKRITNLEKRKKSNCKVYY